jgi:hypothetical protein
LTASLLFQPIYVLRYVLPSLPFFLLFIAAGVCELRPILMQAGCALLLVANFYGTLEYYRVPSKPEWRQAVEFLASRIRPQDKLAVVPWYEWCPFKYNLSQLDHADLASMAVFPARDSLSYFPTWSSLSLALAPTYSRLWVIDQDDAPEPDDNGVLKDLRGRYLYSSRRNFRGISVAFYGFKDNENTDRVREVRNRFSSIAVRELLRSANAHSSSYQLRK